MGTGKRGRIEESGEHHRGKRRRRPKRERWRQKQANDHHDGLEPTNQPSFFLFVYVFDMFAYSLSFVLSCHKKIPPPPLLFFSLSLFDALDFTVILTQVLNPALVRVRKTETHKLLHVELFVTKQSSYQLFVTKRQ